MPNDIAVEITSRVPVGGITYSKPSYLITIEDSFGKTKIVKYFITLDKPDILDGFVQVKGIYSELAEEEIVEKFATILTSAKKELFLELMIPLHRISCIRNLVFKAK